MRRHMPPEYRCVRETKTTLKYRVPELSDLAAQLGKQRASAMRAVSAFVLEVGRLLRAEAGDLAALRCVRVAAARGRLLQR